LLGRFVNRSGANNPFAGDRVFGGALESTERQGADRDHAGGSGMTANAIPGYRSALFPLEAEVRDPQALSIVAHHAFDVLRKAFGGLGVYIERQRHPRATDTIQLAQDRLGDIADLRRRTIGVNTRAPDQLPATGMTSMTMLCRTRPKIILSAAHARECKCPMPVVNSPVKSVSYRRMGHAASYQ
jgi:hypothetical protein